MIPILTPRKSVASSGAGSFFVHRATERNISSNWTTIEHPHTNGDPNAILMVTPNWNPGGSGGTYNAHPIGVWYTDGHWAIFNQDRAPMPVGAAFNVAVVNQLPVPPASTSSADAGGERIVNADGTVELRYPDGSKTLLFEGGMTRVTPDGQRSTMSFSQVPPSLPAALPGEPDVVRWLESHNANLLNLISGAASDGTISVDNYLRSEGAGLSLYQKVERRRLFVQRMLAK